METPKYLQTLWSYKWLLAFGLVVAAVAAFFAGFSITNGEVQSRAVQSYTASTTVLVTSPNDTLFQSQVPGATIEEGVSAPEPLDLASATQIYAYLVSGAEVRTEVEAAVGPLDEDTESITAIRRTTQPAGDERFPGSLKLPVLQIVGTAPTAERAEEISAAATDVFLGYVADQQEAKQIAPENRVELEVLSSGAAVASATGNPAIPIVVTGFAVFLGFVALAFVLAAIRSNRNKRNRPRRRSRAAAPTGGDTAPDSEANDIEEIQTSDDDQVLVGAGTRAD
ncbi:hypothetical protein [Agromyces aureus]|uniref:Polysaccharide chain length determinant N-terminal domain-containing protein n=1 Tax=Agromyces aureus TaxID=453304 RepID=A0A191WDE7_9MICO|nr:hypothetical protein [Agromyces aureus]ANJ26286.1 hypothetical protein ATC03_05685 [Agromyces aureus]